MTQFNNMCISPYLGTLVATLSKINRDLSHYFHVSRTENCKMVTFPGHEISKMTKIGQNSQKCAFLGQFFDENSNFSASDSKMRTSAQVCGLLSTSMRLLRMVSHREPWGISGPAKVSFAFLLEKGLKMT